MIAIGEDNVRYASAADRSETFLARLHRIDAQVAAPIANQVAIEVVPVRFGEPRPHVDTRKDLLHGVSPQRSAWGIIDRPELGHRPSSWTQAPSRCSACPERTGSTPPPP